MKICFIITIQGHDKNQYTAALEKLRPEKIAELVIDQILSHGNEGAANGRINMQNGRDYAFSDFYVFKGNKGAQIKTMTSYCIEI